MQDVRLSSFLIICLIILALACGGLVHEFVPHTHEEAVIADLMHTALHHEKKKQAPLSAIFVLFTTALAAVVCVTVFRRAHAYRALAVHAASAQRNCLHRGILAYRRFG